MAHEDRHDGAHGREKGSAELEREIDDTRARIDEHARQLQAKLSPGQLLDHAMDRVRSSGARDYFGNLGRAVRDNPVPVALAGIGLGWLALSTRGDADEEWPDDESFDEAWKDGDDLHEPSTLRRGLESVRSGVESAREGVENVAQHAKHGLERARRGLARKREGLRHRTMHGRDQLREGWDRVLEEQPLLLGVFGLAAGAALGFALPHSEREDEWLGEASDDLKARAARKGREGVEKVRETVERVAHLDEGRSESHAPSRSAQSPSAPRTPPASEPRP